MLFCRASCLPLLSKGYRRVLMLDIAKQLKLKSPVHLAKALEEEEGNHHDQRFEPASLLLVEALQSLCRVQGSYRKTESCLQPV